MGSSLPEPESSTTKLTDVTDDALAHCGSYLSCYRDLANMAMASKDLKRATYERWEDFVNKQIALLKFKFKDPLSVQLHSDQGFEHVLLDCENFYLSQGSTIRKMKTRNLASGFIDDHDSSYVDLIGHKAGITCMRSFPFSETPFVLPSDSQGDNNTLLITSSRDNKIRLWWNGLSRRCFSGKGVTTLSEKLLGNDGNVLASGDEDGMVCLWSLSSESLHRKLIGHFRPIKFLSVAGHNNQKTHIASIDTGSEVRLWDAASSSCVGETSLAKESNVVSMKSDESLLYIAVASSSSVVAIDMRTMCEVNSVKAEKVSSFAMLPCQSLLCTGGEDGKAMLWDTRRSSQSVAEMVGHIGSITQLYMDRYKIVTGGPDDVNVNVWETDTGNRVNSFECCIEASRFGRKCSAMDVQGFKIVTCGDSRDICFRNFSTATLPVELDYDGMLEL